MDPDPVGPKTYDFYSSGSGSGSATLENTNISLFRADLESKLTYVPYKEKNVKICQDPAFTNNLKKFQIGLHGICIPLL